jgi:hypothetical protein
VVSYSSARREYPDNRRGDHAVANQERLCAECSLPIHVGDPITLAWYGWTHAVTCPTEVGP